MSANNYFDALYNEQAVSHAIRNLTPLLSGNERKAVRHYYRRDRKALAGNRSRTQARSSGLMLITTMLTADERF